jgi:hypothetical protein
MNLRSCLLALIAPIGVGCSNGGGSDPTHGFDSPYKDPGGGAPACPSGRYLVGNHCESEDDDGSEHHLPWLDDAGKGALDAGRRLDAGDAGRDAGDAGRDAGDAGREAGSASDGGDAALAFDIDPATACLTAPNRFAIAGDDYIYGGPALTFNAATPFAFAFDDAGMARSLGFRISDDGWYVTMASRSLDAGLQVGLYENAERAPFASSGHPGLEVTSPGRSCDTLSGQFQIMELSVRAGDPDAGTYAKLTSLHARFEQHCERPTRANVGCIHYTAATP